MGSIPLHYSLHQYCIKSLNAFVSRGLSCVWAVVKESTKGGLDYRQKTGKEVMLVLKVCHFNFDDIFLKYVSLTIQMNIISLVMDFHLCSCQSKVPDPKSYFCRAKKKERKGGVTENKTSFLPLKTCDFFFFPLNLQHRYYFSSPLGYLWTTLSYPLPIFYTPMKNVSNISGTGQ